MPRQRRVRPSSAPRALTFGPEMLEPRQLLSNAPASSHIPARPETAHTAEVSTLEGHGAHHHRAVFAFHLAAQVHARSHGAPRPPTTLGTSPTPSAPAPYSPAQVRHAYGFDQLSQTGAGQTIAIVDAYDDPTIANDLARFDARFGLPAADFTKVVPASGTPAPNAGWAVEIALDVEWAHAIAPGAKIVLVEAASSSLNDLLAAVNVAVSRGASQVSMSWGGGEFPSQTNFDATFHRANTTFLASSGDNGAGVEYPSASPYLTAVGGTSLKIDAAGNRLDETAWTGSGGGLSTAESQPSYQAGFLIGRSRGVPDVSYDADPNTGVFVSSGGGWFQVGGTSAGAPQWAGLAALVNQGRGDAHKLSLGSSTDSTLNADLYRLAVAPSTPGYANSGGDFRDITSGSSGNAARVGFDLATGLGSPNASKLVPDLIALT